MRIQPYDPKFNTLVTTPDHKIDIHALYPGTPVTIQQYFKLMEWEYPTSFGSPCFYNPRSGWVGREDRGPHCIPLTITNQRARHWFEHCLLINYGVEPTAKNYHGYWKTHYTLNFLHTHIWDFFSDCESHKPWMQAGAQESREARAA